MNIYVTTVKDSYSEFVQITKECFELPDEIAEKLTKKKIKPHLDQLKEDIYLVIETDYVDRVFRDSFYSYYSSKLNDYKRNCIKVSLFNCKVDYSSFRNSEKS